MSKAIKFAHKVIFLSGTPITVPVSATDPGSAVNGDLYYNSTSNQLRVYQNGAWTFLTDGATVDAGTAGQISLFPSVGKNLGPTWVQNSQNISLSITAQPTRSAGLIYSVPNPGDAVTSTSFILTDGASSNLAVINKVLTGFVAGVGTVASTDSVLAALQKLDANDALRVLKTGDTMSGDLTFNGGFGIQSAGTLNIGTTAATTINIGNVGATVNVIGTVAYSQTTNTQITDTLITLNKGGAAASGDGSGFEVEENSLITGYLKVGNTRLSWDHLAPASLGTFRLTPPAAAFTGEILFAALTGNRQHTLPNYSLVWPTAQGAALTLLQNDGAGNLSWTPATAAATPIWVKYTTTFAALSTAAGTNSITLFSLPTKAMLHQVVVKHSTAFSGGIISAYSISIGDGGNPSRFAVPFDVFQAIGDTVRSITQADDIESFAAPTNITITATSVGDNLDQAVAGSVDIWVLTSILT